MVLKNWD